MREGPRDECGVFGLYAPGHEVSRLSYFALYALQHRGQESAGIAAADRNGHIITRRELGLVNQVFTENDLRTLAGELAIGHVRYSTTGANAWENSQPVQRSQGTNGSRRELALAHNGNLINAVELHNEMLDAGVTFNSTSDSEIIAALIATHPADSVEDAIAEVMPRLRGAFSTVVMTKDRVVAFRDPHGLRPLSIGVLPENGPGEPGPDGAGAETRYCVASESCAFDIIGAKLLRDVQPGEMVTLGEDGLTSRMVAPGGRRAFCLFEYIYFARPDSRMNDQVLQVARGRMGEILWREAPVDADLVIAVPDSGNPAARGLARAAGLPQDDGFVKNRYVARTFIQPGQELRKHGLRLKFNPLPEVIAGKRLVVVDDSIVRGNTTRQIVQMLKDAGAAEVHMRISAPPIKHPCHYGIDMSTREEMIAHGRTTEEVAAELGCDSLALPVAGGRLRGGARRTRDALRRVLQRRLPAGGQRRRRRQALAGGRPDPPARQGLSARPERAPRPRAAPRRRASAASRGDPRERRKRRCSGCCTGGAGSCPRRARAQGVAEHGDDDQRDEDGCEHWSVLWSRRPPPPTSPSIQRFTAAPSVSLLTAIVRRVAEQLPIAVLVSGAGTNLQALLDTVHGREARIVAVASSTADAPALARAASTTCRRPCSRAATTPTARRATRRWPTGWRSTARAWSCSPATWSCSARPSSRGFPRR